MQRLGCLLSVVACVTLASCKEKRSERITSSQDKLSFEEFKDRFVYREPWRGGVFIVDGDVPIPTEEGLREYYERAYLEGALIVHQAGGSDAAWDDDTKLALTYCISNNFGSNKDTITEAFVEATENGWELWGNVDFIHLEEEDDNCDANNQNVVFDIRQTSGQSYLARAFFPDQSRSTRNILVDTSSFSPTLSWPLSGIMAHELGHTLGFRHEHTRPESGASQCFEDNNWRALTPYDSTSVMHYPQCNGTGEPLVISNHDKEGIAALYGPAGPPVCGDGFCSGGEACDSCEEDCGACPECGNGTCEAGEDCANCADDCGACPECGDGTCNGDETCGSCEGDCGECVCGHDLCETGDALETDCDPCVAQICAEDPFCCNNSWDSICVEEVTSICGRSCEPEPTCGDGTCDDSEDCSSCETDCGPCEFCGDGTCNADEACDSCEADCGACEFCGDGTCNADETCDSCADDCGPCEFCGDGTCNLDETCETCADDCGACPGGECEHALCETGTTLLASCDPCAAEICEVDPYCCETAWDSLCVREVGSVCEQSCLGAACSHSVCETGDDLVASCDSCVGDICDVDPYCCETAWDSICVGEVASVCSLECN